MELTIVSAEGEMGGGKNEAVTKTVTLENGVNMRVPGFVNAGEKIVVNTEEHICLRLTLTLSLTLSP